MNDNEQTTHEHNIAVRGITGDLGELGVRAYVQANGTIINGITLNAMDTNQLLNYTYNIPRGHSNDINSSIYATTSWENKTVINTNEEFVDYIKNEILRAKNKFEIINSYSDKLRKDLREEICDELIKLIDEGIQNKKEE